MPRDRTIALVDMDCFYVQVEQRLNPSIIGKPCAVVQYNTWKGGGIIAVSYEARKFGVTRQMRGDEAKAKCPQIVLCRVPELRGKADLTRYRDACAEVMQVLQNFADICERASVDEAYLDLTDKVERELENTTLDQLVEMTMACSHIIGYSTDMNIPVTRGQWMAALSDQRNRCLAMAGIIIQRARDAVKEKTGFTCSAGISYNKVLAKLAAGTHKPNQQTILPSKSVPMFFESMPIKKVRFFGGKFGNCVTERLKVEFMSQLTKFSKEELQRNFGEKSGIWLYDMCRGIEHEPVRARQLSKSCGCGKNFTGKARLISKDKVRYWLLQLSSELSERLKIEEMKNNRCAKLVAVGLRTEDQTSAVRSFALKSLEPEAICESALNALKSFNCGQGDQWKPGVTCLSLNASKFEENSKSTSGVSSISSFFGKKSNGKISETQTVKNCDDSSKEELTNNSLPTTSHNVDCKAPNSQRTFRECVETKCDESLETLHRNTYENSSTQKAFGYKKNEIDAGVVNELPDSIKHEIQQFLGSAESCNPHQQKKRTLNGIQKYAVRQKLDGHNNAKSPASYVGSVEGKYTLEDRDVDYFVCAKCGEKIASSKKTEHGDYHFALELKDARDMTVSRPKTREPPKKGKN